MPALILILLVYAFVATAFLGYGVVTARALDVRVPPATAFMLRIWIGLATTLLILQVVNLALPLDGGISFLVFAVGAAAGIYTLIRESPGKLRASRLSRFAIGSGVLVLLLASWIALRCSGLAPDNYDSGLYHFSAIRWIFTYPIVPGLGNLHGRLAFNSSLFSLVAAIDFHPVFDRGYAITNGFLLLLGITTMLGILRPLAQGARDFAHSHPFRYGVALFALPPLGYLALSHSLASPSPDVASPVVQVVIFAFLCQGIAAWRGGRQDLDLLAATILLLAVTATTLKLSNLAFSLVAFFFVLIYWKASDVNRRKRGLRILLWGGALALVWCVRGYLLSGAPFYPSTIGYLPLQWSVPKEAIVDQARWVFGWARQPGTHWSLVLGRWDWFRPWLNRVLQDSVPVVYPVSIAALLGGLAFLTTMIRRPHNIGLEWAVLSMPMVSLIFWFVTAPDVRFVNAAFFLLTISCSLVLLLVLQTLFRPRIYVALFLVVFVLGNFHLLRFAFDNKWALKPCATQGSWISCIRAASWHPIPIASLTPLETASGLSVLTPTTGDQCWDAPLPCTPILDERLSLRRPGILDSGFEIRDADDSAGPATVPDPPP